MDWLLRHEPTLRLAVFSLVLAGLASLEAIRPFRVSKLGRRQRWPANFAMLLLNTAALRMMVPLGATGLAIWFEKRGLGLFAVLDWPRWLKILLGAVVLDLAIYTQHVIFHFVPLLWRLHRVHHSDTEVDVSTGNRFHLFEIILSMGIKAAVVLALGTPPEAVMLFEILLNAGSMFSHSNIRLPKTLEKNLRWFVVTPEMHRIHHSVDPHETNSNFGFNLSIWDRIFRTYRKNPAQNPEIMQLGLEDFRGREDQRLIRLIAQPFRNAPKAAPKKA